MKIIIDNLSKSHSFEVAMYDSKVECINCKLTLMVGWLTKSWFGTYSYEYIADIDPNIRDLTCNEIIIRNVIL